MNFIYYAYIPVKTNVEDSIYFKIVARSTHVKMLI